MPITRVERIPVPDREEVFAIIIKNDATFVVRRNRPDERLAQLAGRRCAAESVAVLLLDGERELQCIRGKLRPLRLRRSIRIRSARYVMRRALPCPHEGGNVLGDSD